MRLSFREKAGDFYSCGWATDCVWCMCFGVHDCTFLMVASTTATLSSLRVRTSFSGLIFLRVPQKRETFTFRRKSGYQCVCDGIATKPDRGFTEASSVVEKAPFSGLLEISVALPAVSRPVKMGIFWDRNCSTTCPRGGISTLTFPCGPIGIVC